MNILHARTDPPLLDRLKEMLEHSTRADFAVGYFFISGFDAVAESLAKIQKARILVGHADKQVTEQVAYGLQQAEAIRARQEADDSPRRRDREESARRAAANVGKAASLMPQDDASERAVASLRDLIASGRAEVRSYARGPLHAKAYLCWYDGHPEPGAAVVGSSNLTLAGFTRNTELNVRVTGDAEMRELGRWFDELWDDSADIGDAIVAELDRSWALARATPYEVYLKALYELYGDQAGEHLPLAPGRSEELANFQLDATAQALGMIDERGGCYIGDVVGLGKTFIGAEILRQLRARYPNDGPPLILCPAGLVPMWRRFNERFGLGAEVVSHSMIGEPPGQEYDDELGRYVDLDADAPGGGIVLREAYPHRGAVLVDEAHNFRNDNRRSRGLRNYLESGAHKVVLLSATPQNLGPMDVYRQLRLFLDETAHGLDIEPVSLEEYFRNAQRWLEYRAGDENYRDDYKAWDRGGRTGPAPMNKPSPPSVPRADVENVLRPVFIRRRRKDIAELYGASAEVNGKPVRFPEPRLENLPYYLDKVYEKVGALPDLMALLDAHKGARYRAAEYVTPQARDKPEHRDLFRARDRIAGLMRVQLLKRLESSIEAFRSTLDALARSNRNFAQALESNYVPIGQTAARMLAGQAFDADELLGVLRQEEERRGGADGGSRGKLAHAAGDFRIKDWIADLDADYAVLSELLARMSGVGPDDDSKLAALREFLERPYVQAGKLLVFSEAETTINYLYDQLNQGGADPSIARLSGSNRDQIEQITRRFSPRANGGAPGGAAETRLLLATDVASEGQNLQDCARVLNYDLHWNPVRLIQRFGRVDRIGSEHAFIHLHNMWPDTQVDANLSLTERLRNRVQSFHDLIGLDTKLLSEAERLNGAAMYRIYERKELPDDEDDLGEVTASQRGVALLQRIRENDPALWERLAALPDGIRSALSVKSAHGSEPAGAQPGGQSDEEGGGAQIPLVSPSDPGAPPSAFDPPRQGETLALMAAGGVRQCYAIGSDLQPRAVSPAQFAAAAACEPDTPAAPLPDDTNERVTAAGSDFRQSLGRRLGRARRPHDARRRYIERCLRDPEIDDPRADDLRRIFTNDLPSSAETALDDVRRLGLQGKALLDRLHALRERHRLNPPDETDAEAAQPRIVRIVCSDGLAE